VCSLEASLKLLGFVWLVNTQYSATFRRVSAGTSRLLARLKIAIGLNSVVRVVLLLFRLAINIYIPRIESSDSAVFYRLSRKFFSKTHFTSVFTVSNCQKFFLDNQLFYASILGGHLVYVTTF